MLKIIRKLSANIRNYDCPWLLQLAIFIYTPQSKYARHQGGKAKQQGGGYLGHLCLPNIYAKFWRRVLLEVSVFYMRDNYGQMKLWKGSQVAFKNFWRTMLRQ